MRYLLPRGHNRGMGMKIGRRIAAVVLAAGALAPVSTLPAARGVHTATYKNVHEVQFVYPSSWQVEDMSAAYPNLADAEQAGAAYIQVFSYNPELVTNPSESVPATQVKIAVLLSRNSDSLDYAQILGRLGDRLVEKSIVTINGKTAWRLHYRIHSEETNETLDMLAVEYVDRDIYARFICYPWNTVHAKEFDALVKSFRYRGR